MVHSEPQPREVKRKNSERFALTRLRRMAWGWLAAGVLLLALHYLVLEVQAAGIQNTRWLIPPVVGIISIWRFLINRRASNTRLRDGKLLSRFGLGNHLSIFRGMELSLLAGFLLIPQQSGWRAWIPALLYTSADILDLLDGYAARTRDEATQLGEELDQLFDGAGMLIATLLAIQYGKLTWWFLPFGAARYLFLAGIRLRGRIELPVHPLPESRSRRPVAGLSMGFMSAVLWPIVRPPASILAGLLFLLPFGASFLRDWLVVSGAADPQSAGYMRVRQLAERALIEFMPILLRLTLAVLLALDAGTKLLGLEKPAISNPGAGFPPGTVTAVFAVVELVAIPLLVLGIAGRFVAFILIFPIGLAISFIGMTNQRAILLIADLLILILGTGRNSLWKPSEALFDRRTGEPS